MKSQKSRIFDDHRKCKAFSRRAQGLPITTIIIAALGILVLVVVGAIFGGQIGKFGRAAGECPGKCVVNAKPAGASPSALFEVRADGKCDEDFESQVSGVYIAKGTPKEAKVLEYKCDACCVATG
jgi:hypothetical protein